VGIGKIPFNNSDELSSPHWHVHTGTQDEAVQPPNNGLVPDRRSKGTNTCGQIGATYLIVTDRHMIGEHDYKSGWNDGLSRSACNRLPVSGGTIARIYYLRVLASTVVVKNLCQGQLAVLNDLIEDASSATHDKY
jgi:hypothetical protein